MPQCAQKGRRHHTKASLPLLLGALFLSGCDSDADGNHEKAAPPSEVVVLRVESPSPESPGAEHCKSGGQGCTPLAAQVRLKPSGLVRTFAGGRVSLDFGGGRRLDLDGLSQVNLADGHAELESGRFSVETTPLIEKESLTPLRITAQGRELTSPADTPTATAIEVTPDDARVTVRSGQLLGVPSQVGAVGQTFRLASSQIFRTGVGGQELLAQSMVAPRSAEFGELLASNTKSARGLGTMSARLPNTDQVRTGVNLKNHLVRVVIRDGFARTEVEEEFANTTPHVLEGRYRFPVPGDASLSRLALWVGDQLIEGEVLERKRAADIYKSIVDRPVPRDPALLEWVTGGEMSLKVFPILPKKSRKVVLAYNQALSTEGGVLRYVYPLSLGANRETTIEKLSIQVHASDSRGELKRLRVAGYDAQFGTEGSWHTAQFEARGLAPNRDFILHMDRVASPEAQLSTYVPTRSRTQDKLLETLEARPSAGKSRAPRKGEGHFALRVTADLPKGTPRPAPQLTHRALVLDISHSQSKETIRAQAALAYGVLRETLSREQVLLLACDSACSTFEPGGQNASLEKRLDAARDWLEKLAPGGSSDIAGALVAGATLLGKLDASPGQKRQLIYVGDGQASSGDLSTDTIVERTLPVLVQNKIDVRLIGAGRTLDEDMLQRLAQGLDATFDSVHTGISLEERIFQLSASLRKPVLRGATLRLPPGLNSDGARSLPALRLGQEWITTGTIENFSSGQVVLLGNLDGLPYQKEQKVSLDVSSGPQNPLVPRLWARDQIRAMESGPVSPETSKRIVALSTAYRTMSRSTSFLVLESEQMYKDFGVARTSTDEADQMDAGFSARTDSLSPPGQPQSMPSKLSSLEELEPSAVPGSNSASARRSQPKPKASPVRGMGALSTGSGAAADREMVAPLPAPAPRPRPAPRPAIKGMAKSKAESSSTRIQRSGCMPGDPMCLPNFRPRPRARFHRRAFLDHRATDDNWRSWGAKNLEIRREKLAKNPESRSAHEELIRATLQSGRFKEALDAAIRFTELDPDHGVARQLLAYAAVVNGDHELARQMIDVRTETAARDLAAHAEAARSFDAVGDRVRSCAHYRSLAELAPKMTEASERAELCWQEMLGSVVKRVEAPSGKPGQLQVEVRCEPSIAEVDCPSPTVITPDGRVLSPWTPGVGASHRGKLTLVKLRTGDYFILVLGGSPEAKGKVHLTGRFESKVIPFQGGTMHTVAKTGVQFRSRRMFR